MPIEIQTKKPVIELGIPGPAGGGGSAVELDTTLTQSGKAADAKAVGDALNGKQNTLIQSGATVGQIAKITAVDDNGKPTAWQAVDMASGGGEWELINEATLTEDEISEITISGDSNGNPFELSSVYLLIFGKGSVDSGININIQSTTNESYKNTFHNFGLLGSCLSTDGKWSAAYIEHICNTEWNTAFKGSAKGSVSPAATQNYDAYIERNYATWQAKPDGNIRAVKLTTFSGTFSSGAKLILYGKRV